jgi:hypothetical protein
MENRQLYTITNKVTKNSGRILAVSKYEAIEKARYYDHYKYSFDNYKAVKFKG